MKVIGKAPRWALFTVVVLALGCLIAACGSASGSNGSSSASSSSTTTASAAAGGGAGGANPARRTALVACLKQHGVTLPSRPAGAGGGPPGGPPGGGTGTGTTGTNGTGTTPRRGFFGGGRFANNPKLQAAFKACGANFGAGGRGFRGRLSRTNITKYVTCVREHGYNLPNTNFSGKGPIFPANIQSNAKFQAASKACQSLLIPPRPSGSGTGTNTTTGA